MSAARKPNRAQTFLLPPSMDEWVAKDDPVRFVADLVDSLDLRSLGFCDPPAHARGQPPFAASMLLGIWLYGYLRRIRSCRALELACRERMPLLWLTGRQFPDHNTLWRFFREHKNALRGLFKKLVQLAHAQGLVGLVLHALDGTKLVAACSNESAWHRKTLLKDLEPLLTEAIEQAMAQVQQARASEQGEVRLSPELTDAVARREAIEKGLAELDAAETDHLHPQDPQARMMRGNHTVCMSYNAQAVVDENQFVVETEVVSDEHDAAQGLPMLEATAAQLGERPMMTAMDSGYVSADALTAMEQAGHPVVVPAGAVAAPVADPATPYDKAHFHYDNERDVYVCPRGEVLLFQSLVRSRRNAPELAVYRCKNKDCPVRKECSKDSAGRTVRRSPNDEVLARQRKRQQGAAMVGLYALRKVLVEPVFAQLKWVDGFRRFTVRGLEGVRAQWALVCSAYNLRKLYRHWLEGRFRLAG